MARWSATLKKPISVALLAWLLSRAIVFLCYQTYLSDTLDRFHELTRAFENGLSIYKDYPFSYGPLAVPFVYLPYYISHDFETYRRLFQLEMFAGEVIMLWFLVKVARQRLAFSERQTAAAIVIVAVLGLFQGHLIYDRLDVLVAASLMGSLWLFGTGREGWLGIVPNWAGALVKLIPILWYPARLLAEMRGPRGLTKRGLESIALRLGAFIASVLAAMALCDYLTGGGLRSNMAEHVDRGVQVETLWASVLFSLDAIMQGKGVPWENTLRSQSIASSPELAPFLFVARYAGLLVVGIFYLVIGLRTLNRRESDPDPRSTNVWHLTACLAVLTLSLAFQKVLSPQFFIWLIPALALYLVNTRSHSDAILVILTYALTYVEFDLGYLELLRQNPVFIASLAARNICTVWLAIRLTRSTLALD